MRTSLIFEEEEEEEATIRTSWATEEARRAEEEEEANEAAEELEEGRGLSMRTFSLCKNLFSVQDPAFTSNLLSVDRLSKIGW